MSTALDPRGAPCPDPRTAATFVDVARARANGEGAADAFTFVEDGGGERRLTYAELDRRARTLAVALVARGLAGERALLVVPPGLEYVVALLGSFYAGVVAVPAYPPPARGRGLADLERVAEDAEVRAGVTIAGLIGTLSSPSRPASALSRLEWIDAGGVEARRSEDWRPPAIGPEAVALLQYTSGSTTEPRGVVLTHGNLVRTARLISEAFDLTTADRSVTWLPPYHDMGLVGGLLEPLYAGASTAIISPQSFLRRPALWLETISRTRATVCGASNFAYDLCVRRVPPAVRARLDLRAWRVAFNGAEPVRAETLDAFCDAFGGCGFRASAFLPCYGLAEATLLVSGADPHEAPVRLGVEDAALEHGRVEPAAPSAPSTRTFVGCGTPRPEQEIRIVDPALRVPAAPGRVGEIWVRGPGVAKGYWRRAEQTAATFAAFLADGAGPYLRTGDLGFVHEGELFVTGRLKDLVVVRGKNHYPQDIEATAAAAHAAVRPGRAAAFVVHDGGEERLVLACELQRPLVERLAGEVARAVGEAVTARHGLNLHALCAVEPGRLPRTPSGKPRRQACRRLFLEGQLQAIRRDPASALERRVPAEVVADVRGVLAGLLDLPPADVDRVRRLSPHDLDSLAVLEFQEHVLQRYGVELPLDRLASARDLEALASDILAGSRRSPGVRRRTLAPTAAVRTIETLDDMRAVSHLLAASFGRGDYQEVFDFSVHAHQACPLMPKGLGWVVEQDGRVVAAWQLLDHAMQVGRSVVRMAGAQTLVVDPRHWGRGHPDLLVEAALPKAIAAGFDLVVGFTALPSYYERFGAVTVMPEYGFTFEPPEPPRAARDGFREMAAGDVDRVLDLYHRSNAGRTGALRRSAQTWPWLYRRPPLMLVEPDGYLGLRAGPGELELSEIAGEGAGFYERAVGKLGALARDCAVRTVTAPLPPDHPFVAYAASHEGRTSVRHPKKSGCMARILDLRRLLGRIAPELEARLAASPYAGCQVRMRWTGGDPVELLLNPHCRREVTLELPLPLPAMAQLVFGYKPAAVLLAEERLPPDVPGSALLATLFPVGYPHTWKTDRF
jgi:acyl-CoA synthetase (AMP-forming)/AMP-acid ligase II/predicted N-acetyltransferase YhbS